MQTSPSKVKIFIFFSLIYHKNQELFIASEQVLRDQPSLAPVSSKGTNFSQSLSNWGKKNPSTVSLRFTPVCGTWGMGLSEGNQSRGIYFLFILPFKAQLCAIQFFWKPLQVKAANRDQIHAYSLSSEVVMVKRILGVRVPSLFFFFFFGHKVPGGLAVSLLFFSYPGKLYIHGLWELALSR